MTNMGVCSQYTTSKYDDLSIFSDAQLQKSINTLVELERYEEAAIYRDELNKRKNK